MSLRTCGACGQPRSNPLTHVCASGKGDFARRAAEHKRAEAAARRDAAAAARKAAKHDYADCRDTDCSRYPCRVYREGIKAGRAAGIAEGYSRATARATQTAPAL